VRHHGQSNGHGGSSQRWSARGCLAASVDGDEGWWRDRMPSGKRAVSLVEVIERGGRAVGALQRQEPIGQEHSAACGGTRPRATSK